MYIQKTILYCGYPPNSCTSSQKATLKESYFALTVRAPSGSPVLPTVHSAGGQWAK